MPLVNVPSLAQKLFRRYRLVTPPDSVLGPEMVPVVILDDLAKYEEAKGFNRVCYGAGAFAGAAGQTLQIALINTLRERIHVTDVWISFVSVSAFRIIRPTAALAGFVSSGSKTFADFRLTGQPQALIQTAAQGLPSRRNLFMGFGGDPARVPVHVPLDVTLEGGPPGVTIEPGARAIIIHPDEQNIPATVTWRWVEGIPEG